MEAHIFEESPPELMRITPLVLSIGFLPFTYIAQSALKSVACDAVAVVQTSRDPRYKPGQRLCEGQVLSNPSTAVLIKCVHSGSKFWLTKAKQLSQCTLPVSTRSSQRGSDPFFRARGDEKKNEPKLLQPEEGLTRSVQPTLRWQAVPGAERYLVTIWSDQPKTIETTQTSLSAQTGMPLLTKGETYTIIVKAISRNGLISRSVSTLKVLR